MTYRIILFGCMAVAMGASQLNAAGPSEVFITHRDGKLYEGNQEYRFVSWNIPNLHCVEDSFEFLGDTPWRWPDAFEIADALESTRQIGGTVVRTYVISVRREDGDMGDHVHVFSPGEFNEEAFVALDLVLKIAREKGVRVIIPLVDNWHWWGGVRQYEAFRGKPKGSFWTDRGVIADYKKTVEYVLNRRNSLTGVLYRDDPTIFGWETGNELDATPEWTREIAAYLKELDPNHLVIDGSALHGVPVASLDDPNIDVVTTHHYPNVGNNNAASVIEAIRTVAGKKAYFVGEFGFLPVDDAQQVLDTVIDQGASGTMYWSLRFHRREGGFYWHEEQSGDDGYKAYHWPGFAAGEAYREHLVLPMLREAAFRIRGLALPDPPAPAAPTMLVPTSPRLLSWQGSAGASSYDVQRSTGPSGPWETIADRVSDAAVQYRPLYADESAEVGVGYHYRVIARNDSGDSPPSAPIGPLVSRNRMLVDELKNLGRLADTSGEIQLETGNARKTQEDIHRLRLTPGSTVTYRVDGPCSALRVWAFAQENAALGVETSADGSRFQEQEVSVRTPEKARNDYGYLRPHLITIREPDQEARWIRLGLAEEAKQDVQLSRVEIDY